MSVPAALVHREQVHRVGIVGRADAARGWGEVGGVVDVIGDANPAKTSL